MKSKRTLLWIVLSLTVTTGVALARLPSDQSAYRETMNKHPILMKYLKIEGSSWHGWKNPDLHKSVKTCGGIYACDHFTKAFGGTPDPAITEYYRDAFDVHTWQGKKYLTLANIHEAVSYAAPVGSIVFKVPDAKNLIGKTLPDAETLEEIYSCEKDQPYWALFYLSAKDKTDLMLAGLKATKCKTKHWVAGLWSLSSWQLTPTQQDVLVKLCTETILPDKQGTTEAAACLRYLGRIRTKDAQAVAFIRKLSGSSHAVDKCEAIRAAGNLELAAVKSALAENLKSAYYEQSKNVKVGRKYVQKKTDTWRTHFVAVPTAVALLGLGDATAAKAVAYWLAVDKTTGEMNDSQGFAAVFREAPFASPKARKKLMPMLLKAYKDAAAAQKRSTRIQPVTLMRAALGLVQAGEKAGLDRVLEVIGGSDRHFAEEVLKNLGAEPERAFGESRDQPGIGHVLVGKDGLSVKDAGRLLAAIKAAYGTAERSTKSLSIRTSLDLAARIEIATSRL